MNGLAIFIRHRFAFAILAPMQGLLPSSLLQHSIPGCAKEHTSLVSHARFYRATLAGGRFYMRDFPHFILSPRKLVLTLCNLVLKDELFSSCKMLSSIFIFLRNRIF